MWSVKIHQSNNFTSPQNFKKTETITLIIQSRKFLNKWSNKASNTLKSSQTMIKVTC